MMPKGSQAVVVLLLLCLSSQVPWLSCADEERAPYSNFEDQKHTPASSRSHHTSTTWMQAGKSATRTAEVPAHDPSVKTDSIEGFPGGDLAVIDSPAIRWSIDDSSMGASTPLEAILVDLQGNSDIDSGAEERCGKGELFIATILEKSGDNSGDEYRLALINAWSGDLAWSANLDATGRVLTAPIGVDINADAALEIITAYDGSTGLVIEAWTPQLRCGPSGWVTGGHSNEQIWSYADEGMRLSIDSADALFGSSSDHVQAQLAIADLDGSGTSDLLVAGRAPDVGRLRVLALELSMDLPTAPLWSADLDRGTHISDPAIAPNAAGAGASALLTTLDSDSGSMWAWRIDGNDGGLLWDRTSLEAQDGDTRSPHLRLPSPIIANMDDDELLEVLFTLPTDGDGNGGSDGAEFVLKNLVDRSEEWRFEVDNGWADAPPLVIDRDRDGAIDRICYITWFIPGIAQRRALVGCHDTDTGQPVEQWTRTIDHTGVLREGIATSAPTWQDLDGDDDPELIVAYDRRIHAYEGDDGDDIPGSSGWSEPLETPQSSVASPATADVDGDGALDIAIGAQVIGRAIADIRPTKDGSGIRMVPEAPDPGQQVTIVAEVENIGTVSSDRPIDVRVIIDGNMLIEELIPILDPVAPSGDGSPVTVSIDWTATIGIHQIELHIDPSGNLTQARRSEDILRTNITVRVPFEASISAPTLTLVDPGAARTEMINLLATGKRSGNWTLNWDTSTVEPGWSVQALDPLTTRLDPGKNVGIRIRVTSPNEAQGGSAMNLGLTLIHEDGTAFASVTWPLAVNRTRGLHIIGAHGSVVAEGLGRDSESAQAWLRLSNLGNAPENILFVKGANPWNTGRVQLLENGTEIASIIVQPASAVELIAVVSIPENQPIGDSITIPLTARSDDNGSINSTVDLRFTVHDTTTSPPHIRTTPKEASWSIIAALPNGSTNANWDMSETIASGWTWTATQDFTLGANLSGNSPDGRLEGTLKLSLPIREPPGNHDLRLRCSLGDSCDIYLHLDVLQIHRALLEWPTHPSPVEYMDVETPRTFVLDAVNPGNSADDYLLTSVTVQPLHSEYVQVTFPDSSHQIQSGAATSVTMIVELDPSTPALEAIPLEITLKSTEDSSAFSIVQLNVSANPIRRWNATTLPDALLIEPGSFGTLSIEVLNQGNHRLSPTASLYIQMDYPERAPTSPCVASISPSDEADVNSTAIIVLNWSVPSNSWAGTRCSINLTIADDTAASPSLSIEIVIKHRTGWSVQASDPTINPNGEQIHLRLEQLGNRPTTPIVTLGFPRSAGWNQTNLTQFPDTIDPGGNVTISVNIHPKVGTIAGSIGELDIIIDDVETSTVTSTIVLLIVDEAPSLEVIASTWVIGENGGECPTLAVHNNGNVGKEVSLEFVDVANWSMENPFIGWVGAGEIRPASCGITTPANWDGTPAELLIRAKSSNLTSPTVPIRIERRAIGWAEKPLVYANGFSMVGLNTDSATELSTAIIGTESLKVEGTGFVWKPATRLDILEVSLTNLASDIGKLDLIVVPIAKPDFEIFCEINENWNATASPARCTSTDAPSAWTMIFRIDGAVYSRILSPAFKGYQNVTIPSEEVSQVPAGGHQTELTVVDEWGRLIIQKEAIWMIHQTGWNIGILRVDSVEGGIEILPLREGIRPPIQADCQISLTSDKLSYSWDIDLTAQFLLPIQIQPPSTMSNTTIEVRISCASPWDVDDDPSDDASTINWVPKSSLSLALTIDARVISGTISALTILALAWILFQRNREDQESDENMTDSASNTEVEKQERITSIDGRQVSDSEDQINKEEVPKPGKEEPLLDDLREHLDRQKPTDDLDQRIEAMTARREARRKRVE